MSTLSGDAKQLDFYEGRSLETDKNATQSGKHENSKGIFPDDPSSEGFCLVSHKVDDSKNILAFSGQTPDTLSYAVSKHSFSIKARPKDKNSELTARLQIYPKISDCVQSSLDHNDSGNFRSKEEVYFNVAQIELFSHLITETFLHTSTRLFILELLKLTNHVLLL